MHTNPTRPLSVRGWLPPTLMLGAWVACGNATLAHIELEGKDEVTVSGGSIIEDLLGDLGFDGFTNMNLADSEKLKNQGVEPGDIKDVRLVSFELETLSPKDGDLSFLSTVEIWVESPGLEPVLIAEAVEFPKGTKVVSFDVMDVDLTDFVVSESMTLTTEIEANSPKDDTRIRASYLLDVGVTIQGAKNQACN
mgnify:CR=1 FL=1